MGLIGLPLIGFETMGLLVIGGVTEEMLPMEGLELPIGWRGSPPLAGISTISRRLLYRSPLYLAAKGQGETTKSSHEILSGHKFFQFDRLK